MKKNILGQYKEFKCIADKCPSTCCSGWAIEVDDESIVKYKELKLNGVDYSEQCFKNKSNGDCYFLNEHKLCNLYLKFGDGIFCRTCDMYPRHIEEFPDIREYSLSISCPEVARMYTEPDVNVTEIINESDDEIDFDEYEDFDFELYEALVNCRKVLFEISLSDAAINNKLYNILHIASELQDNIDIGNYDPVSDEKESEIIEIDNDIVKKLFGLFLELEPLNTEFRNKVVGYKNTIDKYDFCYEFARGISSHDNMELILSRILHYFIYTYSCGAVYDEYVYGMAAVSVFSTIMIFALWIISEHEKGSTLSNEEIIKIIYTYSRELEHSTENMIKLEHLLEDNRLL